MKSALLAGWVLLMLITASNCARMPYRIGLPATEESVAEPGAETAADYNMRGLTYEQAGRYEKAIRAYRLSIAMQNENYVARTNLGNVLAKLGRFDEARKSYRDVLAADPENLNAINNLAWLLISTGDERDCEEGVALAGRCLSLAAGAAPIVRASILDTMAWGNHRLHRRAEQLQHIREAASLLGKEELNKNPLIWGHYRIILREAGGGGLPDR